MKKRYVVGLACAAILTFGIVSKASAFFINFENGTEGGTVTDITGVSFHSYNGYAPLYGDTRTGNYNTHSDDLNIGSGYYHHNGNFFVWAGMDADARGVIVDFTNNDGTWFTTGYSANTAHFYLDAYLTNGTMVQVSGNNNYGNAMNFLTVNATTGTYIDYVVLHDTGNYWLVDDMSGDATGVGAPVPEPASMLLMGTGLAGLACLRRKRAAKKA